MIETILVVPCYNEVKRLDAEAFVGYVDAHPSTAFVFVDDGSSDATAGMLRHVTTRRPAQLSALRLDRNFGKAEAVRRGILLALQLEPSIRRVLGCRPGHAARSYRTPARRAGGASQGTNDHGGACAVARAPHQAVGSATLHRARLCYIRVTGAGHSHLRHAVWRKLLRASRQVIDVFQTPFRSRWIFDVELIERLLRSAQTAPEASTVDELIVEVPLQEWRDVGGSKIRPWNGVSVAVELWLVRWRLRHPPPSPPTAAVTDTNAPHDRRASI